MINFSFYVHLDAQKKKIVTQSVNEFNTLSYDTLSITLDVSDNGTQPFFNTVCVPMTNTHEALKKAIGLLKMRMDSEEYKFSPGSFIAISHDIVQKSKESFDFQEISTYSA